jgi:catechol 2,3-dioxygenase-like lactoylglutathione lyase family enzyme
MRLYGIRVLVHDIAEARAFYGDTLGLKESWSMPEIGAAGFALDNAELIVEEEAADGPDGELVGRFVGVSIQVSDIDGTYEQLRGKGVAFESPPERQAWGGTLAHFRDPAGNILTLLG